MKLSKKILELETKETKYCLKCKKIKPLYEFIICPTGRKLARGTCIECQKEGHKEHYILSTHGITLKDYDKLLEKQDGGCMICGTKIPRGPGRFHVDHDHKTNKIRGLLCNNCNLGLGYFGDNPETLAKAIQYLTRK